MVGQVVILGPGLLGGSLALALAERGEVPIVWGRRRAPLEYLGKIAPRIRIESRLEAALAVAEFVVLATPIGVMPLLLERIARECTPGQGVTVTDVGSVKAPIVEKAETLLGGSDIHFVGSHPMAGSEASGVEAARADLFAGAMCLLTPTEATHPRALQCTSDFWAALECRVHQLSAEEHDAVVARVSHMPHAMASLVVGAALRANPAWAKFAGGGLHDTTRIASGEPEMWAEILLENRHAVLDALRAAESDLQELIKCVETGEKEPVQRFLLEAKELRDTHIVPQR